MANGGRHARRDERGQALEQYVDLGAVARGQRTGQGGDLEGDRVASSAEVARHECRVTCLEKRLTAELDVQLEEVLGGGQEHHRS